MPVGTLALVFGIVFIAVGLVGFGAAPPPPDAPPLHAILAIALGVIGFAMPARTAVAR